MPALPNLSTTERRRRLGRRHHLAPSALAESATQVAGTLAGLHSTDPATVHLSACARLRLPSIATVERELYEDRSLVRILGMRRTLFVEPLDMLPVVQAAASDQLAEGLRRRYVQLLADGRLPDPDAFFREAEAGVLEALAAQGGLAGSQIAQLVPQLRHRVNPAAGKSYGAETGITTWVLTILAVEGRIVRGRPRGSWISSQYTWWPTEKWLGARPPALEPAAAAAALVQRWLRAFGPATLHDIAWWTGWTLTRAREATAAIATEAVLLEDGTAALVLAGDAAPEPEVEPWVALLPPLDPTTMGWQGREWYLGPHGPVLFDRNGNAGPTVWADGRIVGGWGQRAGGEVVWRLLTDVGSETESAVAAAAARLEGLLDGTRVSPRFPAPLQKELGAL